MNKEYLFAYGTLRRDFVQALKGGLAEHMLFINSGKVRAELYDLGAYPGAVKRGEAGEVTGDLMELMNEGSLALLDDYEGEEYSREKTLVNLPSGEKLEAWIYWYTGKTAGMKQIDDGDYLSYLKNKKDSFV